MLKLMATIWLFLKFKGDIMEKILFKHSDGDCSKKFENFISKLEDNVCIDFEKKDYYFSKKVYLKNKNNLILNGNGATVISEFNPACHENYTGILHFENCKDIKIANFNVDTSEAVTPGGEIIAVDNEIHTFDVKLYANRSFDGSQRIIGMNSMDSKGTPDGIISATHAVGFKYETIGEGIIRIFHKPKSNKPIKVGSQICLRHAYAGFARLKNSAFTFRNSTDIFIENMNIYSSVYYLFVIFPRCHNLTLKKVYVGSPKKIGCLMGTNVDAVHILGLSGKLIMEDCVFSGLGDDALNIHSSAYTVIKTDKNEADLIHYRPVRQETLPTDESWCRKGDKIIVFNPDFSQKGTLTVKEFNNGKLIFSDLEGKIKEGDILANSAFYATVDIKNCLCENSRVRAFILQTENVSISNCKFFGMASPAIIIAPDIEMWSEVGPAKNIKIENCIFEKCGISETSFKKCSIISSCCHSFDKVYPEDVHKNLTILNNKFIDSGAIFLNSTTGIDIENNQFVDCTNDSLEELIVFQNCKEIKLNNNIINNQ